MQALVFAEPMGGDPAATPLTATTDADGRFDMTLAPGTYHVHAENDSRGRTLPVEIRIDSTCPPPIVLTFEKFRP